MPLEEPPALFGFHPNANITKQLKETDDICYDLLKMGEIEGVKRNQSQKEDGKVKTPSGKRSLMRKRTLSKEAMQ